MQNLNPIATQQYIDKSIHFLQGMKALAGDIPKHTTGIGLLAVHSAISLTDAIVIGVNGKRGKYQDNRRTSAELFKLCQSKGISNLKGVDHLRWLIGEKNAIAYENRRFEDSSVKIAIDRAEKFNAWAYNYFEEILRAQSGT